ncbi:LURP-one-related/scramblase family protein [Planctomycetota bacterium]
MRYQMTQKLLTLSNDFMIKDAEGEDVYFVKGKLLSFAKQLYFKDMQDRELAYIKQKLMSFTPCYEIYREGKLQATVKGAFFRMFGERFSITLADGDAFELEGCWADYDFSFSRGGRMIADISKKFFALRDSYGIDIADGEDDVLILCCAVVIDMVCHTNKD